MEGEDAVRLNLSKEINVLEEEKSCLNQTIVKQRKEFNMMDGSARAVELAEDAQTILAKLETDVERYVHLRLASTVLAQAIERYREKHQGPILKRTNELFANLTLNFFEGVRADFDDHDNPVLVGVRMGDEEVRVEGMGDGTTHQLYLALRLASLETYLKNNEPMPFLNMVTSEVIRSLSVLHGTPVIIEIKWGWGHAIHSTTTHNPCSRMLAYRLCEGSLNAVCIRSISIMIQMLLNRECVRME